MKEASFVVDWMEWNSFVVYFSLGSGGIPSPLLASVYMLIIFLYASQLSNVIK